LDKMTRRLAFLALALACTAALPACSDSTGSRVGPAANLDVVSGNTQTAPAGTELPQPVVVKVTDAKGHVVKGQVVNFVVTAGGGHVFAGSSATNEDGVAQERWTLGTAAGPQTLEVRAVDNATGQALVFATFNATAAPGAPTRADAVADSSVVGVVGSVVEDSFAVQVRDQYGNPTPGVQIAWAVTSGGGSITTPSTTDAAGIARTQWVLGTAAVTYQTATATVAGKTITFVAYPATSLNKLSPDGPTVAAGTQLTRAVSAFGAGAGPVVGLAIHWTVGSGGGSVAPAVGATSSSGSTSATWTLGPAAGPQTLTASAGGLSVTYTTNVVAAGPRTLLAQLPSAGRAIDATPDRVLWIDNGTRVISVRTLSNGADATVKTDTVKNANFGWNVAGHLYTGGALLWNPYLEVFDWRGGSPAYLGNPASEPAADGDWAAYYLEGSTGLVRRNLAAATAAVIPGGTRVFDVGPDGTLVYVYGSGGSLVTVTPDRFTSSAPTQSPTCGGIDKVLTDGVNAGYICRNTAGLTVSAWLSRPGGDELLTGTNYAHGAQLSLLLAGGWTAYGNTGDGTVNRRAPGGTKTQLNPAGTAAVLVAISPSGAVVYSMSGQYYKAAANGSMLAEGPAAQGEQVVWRGDRFLLVSGSAVYDLGS
jgi:hypothetical protein